MKGDNKVIDYLDKALGNELVAINQYMVHSRMQKKFGLAKLCTLVRTQAMDEMRHAELFLDRVLFLDGTPKLEPSQPAIGHNVKDMLTNDLNLETNAIALLRDAAAHCETAKDFVSQELFQTVLANEEAHVEWIESQLKLIDGMGLENYIQIQS